MRALAKRELMAPQPEHWTYNTSTGWSIIANDEGRLSKSEETEKTKTVLVGTHHESKSRWDRAYNWHEWFTQSAEEKRYKNEKYYKQNAGSCRTNAKNFEERYHTCTFFDKSLISFKPLLGRNRTNPIDWHLSTILLLHRMGRSQCLHILTLFEHFCLESTATQSYCVNTPLSPAKDAPSVLCGDPIALRL